MMSEKCLCLRILTYLSVVSCCCTFNADLSNSTLRFVLSPSLFIFGEVNSANRIKTLPSGVDPSFFGYSLDLKKFENKNMLSIGSPKMTDPQSPALQVRGSAPPQEPKGSIGQCVVTSNLFRVPSFPCPALSVPESQHGDNFGLSVPGNSDGHLLACSITRNQDCGNIIYIPGGCLTSKDLGISWNAERITAEQKCPTLHVDVLFVLDGSGSVGKDFKTVKNWVKEISQKLGLEDERVTVGVVQYSHYREGKSIDEQPNIVTEIEIGQYRTYKSFSAAVDDIKLQGHTTYTGRALQKVLTDFKNSEQYGKKTTKQVMILLTDGNATDQVNVSRNAQNLRDIGVIPYAVGVGKRVATSELRVIANGGKENNTRVYMAQDFSGLDVIAKELEAEIGALVLEGQGGINSSGYAMQFGQLGFSNAYGKSNTVGTPGVINF